MADAFVGSLNTVVLQLPLGFIRVIEIPMAILAFATTSGYSGQGSIKLPPGCTPKTAYPIEFEYPFNIEGTEFPAKFCNSTGTERGPTLFEQGFSSQAQFYVFTGVVSFLYALAILIVYMRLWSSYENDPKFAMIDFAATALLALFWFAGSCAWASGVDGVKVVTGVSSITDVMKKVSPCNEEKQCQLEASWNYASLNVSLIAGFACTALWIANLWFIYKETVWHKNKQAQDAAASIGQPGQPGPMPGSTVSQPAYR